MVTADPVIHGAPTTLQYQRATNRSNHWAKLKIKQQIWCIMTFMLTFIKVKVAGKVYELWFTLDICIINWS